MAKGQFVLACLVLGACDYAFRIDRINTDATVPPGDGPAACAPLIDDSLDDGNECAPWGMAYENVGAMVRELATGLTITPANVATSSGGCITSDELAFRADGFAVEVSSVLTGGGGEYMQLQAFADVGVSIGVVNTELRVVDSNSSAIVMSAHYDPIAMRWWRLRPGTPGAEVFAETSPDGADWTLVAGISRTTIPSVAVLNLIAGLGDTQTTFGGSATFRRLLVCQ
jgi:hypothetical protein